MVGQVKSVFLFPTVMVDIRYKRVYAAEKLPYPGDPKCNCETCHNKWITSLLPLRSR